MVWKHLHIMLDLIFRQEYFQKFKNNVQVDFNIWCQIKIIDRKLYYGRLTSRREIMKFLVYLGTKMSKNRTKVQNKIIDLLFILSLQLRFFSNEIINYKKLARHAFFTIYNFHVFQHRVLPLGTS